MSEAKQDRATIRAFAVWAGVTIGAILLFVVFAAAGEIAYARMNENRVFSGVRVLDVRLDGMTKDEAHQAVQKAIDTGLAQGLRFRFHGQDVTLDPTPSLTPDSSRDLIRYDIDAAIDQAYGIGRGNGWRQDVYEQLGARISPMNIPASITMDEAGIMNGLQQAFHEKMTPPQDAAFIISAPAGAAPSVTVQEEKSGVVFKTKDAFATLRSQAAHLAFSAIELQDEKSYPTYTKLKLEPLVPDVVTLLTHPAIKFTYEDKPYPVPMSTVATWVAIQGDQTYSIGIDPQKFGDTLRELVPNLEHPSQIGSMQVKDGKLVSFQPGIAGSTLDVDGTLKIMQDHWAASSTFPLVVKIAPAPMVGEDPQRLGIKELIGVGRSNFSGSPSNRRKNIALGVQLVNGTIIAPGEEFSLIKRLGVIDGDHGWLPELVIKGNKTTPEFGGGLCQIGTTTFRAALNSGLKITERQNHSYRVRYYEPAGTDATIYDPQPDLRFVNDTTNSVLIHASIVKDDVIFEFWGTKDGRVAAPIVSKVSNIVDPPPMKLVETLDLPPGQKKCTETAHAGADAEFTYSVTYADGMKHEEVFKSHYRPWQAVCLVGVKELSNPTPSATSTSEVIN